MTDHIIARTALAVALALGASALAPERAAAQQSIACGGDYVVSPGDTLSEIAVRAYGVGRFGPIFEANRDVLASPQRLEVGYRLFIPCLDGTGQPQPRGTATPPAATAAAPAEPAPVVRPAPEAAPVAAAGLPEDGAVRLLALRRSTPLVGEGLPEGGMLTEIVQRALLRAPVPLDFAVSFERNEGVEAVAARGYDLGFPAYRPDCGDAGLGAEARAVCDGFLFSAPLQSAGIGMFVTRTGDFAGARSIDDLLGARLCRPEGMGTEDLEASGLDATRVSLIPARDATECFRMLAFGDVSVVSLPEAEGRAAAEAAGVAGRVTMLEGIGRGRSLHVVASRDNPAAAAWIALIDRGLAEMRESGEYEAVVRNHLRFAGIN
jgi:polar amino acid transport system substrate-binding protein